MSTPNPPPDPSTYRGVKLRTFLETLHRWMLRDRIIAGIGVAIESTPAGRKISAGPGVGGGSSQVLTRVISTASITGRSGGTPGSGAGALVQYSGTAYSTGATITLKTLSGTGHASGKYGWAVYESSDSSYHIVSMDC